MLLLLYQPWMNRAYDPCTERYSNLYLNLPEVQKAFHANVTKLPYPWKHQHCWFLLGRFSTINASHLSGTYSCWFNMGIQVGGWSQIYDGLTYVSVTGAGHEVPLHRPRQAFILLRSFLENNAMAKG